MIENVHFLTAMAIYRRREKMGIISANFHKEEISDETEPKEP
jgi:hypothetical protein